MLYDEHLTNIEYVSQIFVASRQKTLFYGKMFVGDICRWRGGFNLFVVGRYSGYQPSFTKIMIIIRLYDEKLSSPLNIIRFDDVVLYIDQLGLTSLYFFIFFWKNRGAKRSLLSESCKSSTRSNKDQMKAEYEWKKRRTTMTEKKEK